jgi:hypothetical protein
LHDFLKNHFFQKKSKKKVKTFGKKNPFFRKKNPKKSKKNPYGFFDVTMFIDKMFIFWLLLLSECQPSWIYY